MAVVQRHEQVPLEPLRQGDHGGVSAFQQNFGVLLTSSAVPAVEDVALPFEVWNTREVLIAADYGEIMG